MTLSRRSVITYGVAAAAVSVSRAAGAEMTYTPEAFGAKGDGRTNDTTAFVRMSEALNAAGGGTISLRRAVYIVGGHLRGPAQRGWAFAPATVLELARCARGVRILGNGATLRCAAHLRYGTFDPVSGTPAKKNLPFYDPAWRASPYQSMIVIRDSGDVLIQDLELDGSVASLILGGPWGDTGWQVPADGIGLFDNRGSEIVRNVHTHHHARDGIMIGGRDDASAAGKQRLIENLRSEYNGRQGCSIIGGRGYVFRGCRFSHTGKAGIYSAPGAGVDIEAEGGKKIRDLRFETCTFEDNSGCGLLADNGDSEGAFFTRCTFIGTTAWSAWPFKPRFAFHGCRFIGSIVKCFGDPDPERAAQFYDCTFTDNPKQSRTGGVFRAGHLPNGTLADLSDAMNVRFTRCRFEAVAGGVLPWSTGAIYEDCVMRQTSTSIGYPRGLYRGHNRIDVAKDVGLYGIRIQGELIVNGKPFRP